MADALADSMRTHDPGFTKIMVTARTDRDSVVLRWAPGTPHGWRVANRTGYVVERRPDGGTFERLTPDTLHPWMAQQFIDAMRDHPDHRYLGLVLNALWGDSLLISPGGADTVGDNGVRNANLFGYALFAADNDPGIAASMGLRYVDRHVKEGEHYTYRIRLNEPRDYRIDPGEVEVTVRPARMAPPPVNLTARALDHRIEIHWDPQPAEEYTGYLVSRSADGGKKFAPMNVNPIVIVESADPSVPAQGGFTDTAVVNYRPYVYRVQGVTPFGEKGAGADVKAMARDLTPPPAPAMRTPRQTGRSGVALAWDMPPVGRDLAGFMVLRSAFADSNYHELIRKPLPAGARQYTDARADEAEPYYIVAALDTAGNRAPSFPVFGGLIDTLPPATPTGLRGIVDSLGVVHLAWHANAERSLLGYRVLRANAPDHEFTQLTGMVWPDTLFTDTVATRTLTSHVYYRVAAVNARYAHSRPTPILALRRPDATAPETPVFYDVQATDSTVELHWAASGSPDVASHILSRRVPPDATWTSLATLSRTAVSYVDHAVEQGVMYEYRIEALDSTGLSSTAGLTVQARPFDSGLRPTVTGLSATFDAASSTIAVHWAYAARRSEQVFFLIYRGRKDGPVLRYRSVDGTERSFTDHEINGSGPFTYAVKVMTDAGAESPLSEKVRVNVPGGEK